MNSMGILLTGCGILILALGLYVMYFSIASNYNELMFFTLFLGGGMCIAASIVAFKTALKTDANLIYP